MSYPVQEKLIRVNPKTRPGQKIVVKGVVIHWTANEAHGADNEAHYNYFNKGSVYASAHYFVDSDGILRIIPENERAYHVGARYYKTSKYGPYPNDTMIGVEMCVNSNGKFSETYKRAVWLVANILHRHKLGLDDLERHYDITGKSCPKMFTEDYYARKYMNMTAAQATAKFKKDVAIALEAYKPKPAPAPVKSPSPGSIGKLVVLAPALNVRQSASFDSASVGVGKQGQEFQVYEEKNGLYRIEGNNIKGWCSAGEKYVKYTANPKPAPKPAPAPAVKLPAFAYEVKKGDTLWGIARAHKISVAQLKSYSGLKSDVINPGDILYTVKVHVVQKGDTLWGIATGYKLSVDKLKSINGLKSNVINPGDVLKV